MELQESKILKKFKELEKKLPKFADGRIDYSKSKECLVITVFIMYNKKILLLKRSKKVNTYRYKWSTVTGYIDDNKTIFQKILEEIEEEVGLTIKNISSHKLFNSFEFIDEKINKKWIIYPSKIELKSYPNIKLDWEHSEYKWISPKDILNYDIVPKLDLSLSIVTKK